MWFRSKVKNRRFERGHVLDVKLRSQQVRAVRMRRVTKALTICLGVVVIVFVSWRGGEWALDKLLFQNSAFAVRQVDVQTDGVIALEQLRKWSGVRLGDNLLALDLTRIKRDLELEPSVESAAVERVFPHTLKLRITEREAVAQVLVPKPRASGTGFDQVRYYVDQSGHVMRPLEYGAAANSAAPSDDALPELSGIDPVELRPGLALSSPKAQAALQLIAEFDRSAMIGLADLKRIDLSAPEILQVTTGQGSAITFSLIRLDEQLRRWRLIHDYGSKVGKAIATLDLSITNNLPARWLEASVVPPAIKKPLKTSRLKKKNV